MNNLRFILSVLLLVVSLSACQVSGAVTGKDGSGVILERSGALSPYTDIEVSHAIKVSIVVGESFSYKLYADSLILNKVRIYTEESTLKINMGKSFISKRNYESPVVELTVPSANAFYDLDVELSGASRLILPALNINDLDIQCSGASNFETKETIDVKNFDVECSGASNVSATVKSNDVDVDCSGASRVNISGETRTVDLECSGASKIFAENLKITGEGSCDSQGASKIVLGDIDGIVFEMEASGASSISYLGNPSIRKVETSGASLISKR
ncbi:MAG: DUF2807 domain-containing protein [Marinilabiliaceae bacterium]|nr:DUF2807 domain-containing protein [Marinilabiliaceae bacterium]